MKIGVTQVILPGLKLDEILDLCRDAGYQALELVFGEGGEPEVGMTPTEVKAVGKRCRDAGVEIGSVIAHYADRGNLLSRNPEDREQGKRSLARSLEIAEILGVNATLLHPGQLTPEGTYEQAWDDLKGILKEMAGEAKKKRVAICLENVWNKILLSPKEMREFLHEVGSDQVGAYLDTANMMAYGFPEHWIRSLAGRIKRVHFKDFDRRKHRFVNLMDGDTDWPTIMGELRSVGYEGPVIHEVDGDRGTQIEMARRMLKIVSM